LATGVATDFPAALPLAFLTTIVRANLGLQIVAS
jgi:hypothetical protein